MTVYLRTKTKLSIAIGIASSVLISPVTLVQAAEVTLSSKYNVTFLGVGVGKMKTVTTLSSNRYSISGGVRANSMVALVADARVTFSTSGKIVGNKPIPGNYNVSYKTSKRRGSTKINYASGNVIKVSASPKIKYKPGSVPVEKSHLLNVLDPVSTLLFPVKANEIGNGAAVCNRVVPIFDGKSRINLVMSLKSRGVAKAKGFRGETFTCSVRYKPISGIRPFKKNIKFMKANRDIQVTMARVGGTNVYSLFAFKVKTDKGTATGRAYHFEAR